MIYTHFKLGESSLPFHCLRGILFVWTTINVQAHTIHICRDAFILQNMLNWPVESGNLNLNLFWLHFRTDVIIPTKSICNKHMERALSKRPSMLQFYSVMWMLNERQLIALDSYAIDNWITVNMSVNRLQIQNVTFFDISWKSISTNKINCILIFDWVSFIYENHSIWHISIFSPFDLAHKLQHILAGELNCLPFKLYKWITYSEWNYPLVFLSISIVSVLYTLFFIYNSVMHTNFSFSSTCEMMNWGK